MDIKTLSALSESNRLRIVELLRDGPESVGEIASKLDLRQPQVSKHLRVLSEAGLVEVEPMANLRIYRLRAESFQEMDTWLQSFKHIWDERFGRLDEYLSKLQSETNNEPQK